MISELALSRLWHEGRHARELRTTSGARLHVVYAGVWTHATGPDFRDAMLEVDGQLVRGSVELHVRASDWFRHAHHQDSAYADVCLHVVLDDDLSADVTTCTGRAVPTVVLGAYLPAPPEDLANLAGTAGLGSIGRRTCLPTVAGGREALVRETLRHAGWQRLVEKQLRFAQELHVLPAAEVLYRGLLDGLGLLQNRAGMARVGERLPLALLEAASAEHGPCAPTALLLGVGNFLPLSELHGELSGVHPAQAAELYSTFQHLARNYGCRPIATSEWMLHRVRPANHPVRRLASLGGLVREAGVLGLLGAYLDAVQDGATAWRSWLEGATPAIGRSRSNQLIANVCAPFLAAYAESTSNQRLTEQSAALWELLPGSADDAVARATREQIVGTTRFPIRTLLETQGLHHIERQGCRELRCFECPIAALAVRHEPSHFI